MVNLNVHQVAGWFDSEGTVTYSDRGGVCVSLTNTFHDIPNEFHRQFGGTMSFQIGTNKPAARWSATGRAAYAFIEAILPYSIELYPRLESARKVLELKLAHFRVQMKSWPKKDKLSLKEALVEFEATKKMVGSKTYHRQDRLFSKWTNEEQLSYLGAYFDGDGSIAINRTNNNFKFGVSYSPSVQINIANRKLLDVFKDKFGGSISESSGSSTNVLCHIWGLRGYDQISKFMEQIGPYVVDKVPQFKVMEQLVESHSEFLGESTRRKMTDEQFQVRTELYEEMRRLKRIPYSYRPDADLGLIAEQDKWLAGYMSRKANAEEGDE